MDNPSQASCPKRRSCARCIKAKVKCSVIQDRDINVCERCHRLNRDCEFGNVDLRRRRKTVTRTERLEKRIEELAAQLEAQKHVADEPSGLAQVPSSESAPPGLSTPPVSEDIDTPTLEADDPAVDAFEVFCPGNPPKGEGDIVERGLLSPDRAELLLDKYRNLKMPSFPFVVIPSTKTANALRQESPFLFLAIIVACLEDDIVLQRRVADEVRSFISVRIVLENEKDLGLLQGLLVYLAWYYYHFAPKRHQMYLMLSLARSLVFDLCLDKNPSTNAQEMGILLEIKARLSGEEDISICDDVVNGRRAFLGYYYLASILCICRRGLAMKHTPWVDECIRSLKEWDLCKTDSFIEPLVKIRSLHQNISDTLLNHEEKICQSDSVLAMSQAAFRNELTGLKAEISKLSGLEKYTFEAECLTTTLAIHEIALYQDKITSIRTTSLSTLLHTSKALINLCLRIPDHIITHLSIGPISVFWYAFMILARLVLIPSSPGWDHEIAKREADLAGLGRAARDKLASIRGTENHDTDMVDVWIYFSHVMRSMLMWNKKHAQPSKDDPTTEDSQAECGAVMKFNGAQFPLCDIGQSMAQNTDQYATEDICRDQTTKIAEVQPSPDLSQEAWDLSPSEFLDDSLWQRVLDDFTLLPPAPMGGYPVGAFAPYAYPTAQFPNR